MMTNDYTVNASIVYDLSDAREDLGRIIEMFAPDTTVDESEYRVFLAHVMWHLNCAWNKRNLTDEQLQLIGGEALNELGQFPSDIRPL